MPASTIFLGTALYKGTDAAPLAHDSGDVSLPIRPSEINVALEKMLQVGDNVNDRHQFFEMAKDYIYPGMLKSHMPQSSHANCTRYLSHLARYTDPRLAFDDLYCSGKLHFSPLKKDKLNKEVEFEVQLQTHDPNNPPPCCANCVRTLQALMNDNANPELAIDFANDNCFCPPHSTLHDFMCMRLDAAACFGVTLTRWHALPDEESLENGTAGEDGATPHFPRQTHYRAVETINEEISDIDNNQDDESQEEGKPDSAPHFSRVMRKIEEIDFQNSPVNGHSYTGSGDYLKSRGRNRRIYGWTSIAVFSFSQLWDPIRELLYSFDAHIPPGEPFTSSHLYLLHYSLTNTIPLMKPLPVVDDAENEITATNDEVTCFGQHDNVEPIADSENPWKFKCTPEPVCAAFVGNSVAAESSIKLNSDNSTSEQNVSRPYGISARKVLENRFSGIHPALSANMFFSHEYGIGDLYTLSAPCTSSNSPGDPGVYQIALNGTYVLTQPWCSFSCSQSSRHLNPTLPHKPFIHLPPTHCLHWEIPQLPWNCACGKKVGGLRRQIVLNILDGYEDAVMRDMYNATSVLADPSCEIGAIPPFDSFPTTAAYEDEAAKDQEDLVCVGPARSSYEQSFLDSIGDLEQYLRCVETSSCLTCTARREGVHRIGESDEAGEDEDGMSVAAFLVATSPSSSKQSLISNLDKLTPLSDKDKQYFTSRTAKDIKNVSYERKRALLETFASTFGRVPIRTRLPVLPLPFTLPTSMHGQTVWAANPRTLFSLLQPRTIIAALTCILLERKLVVVCSDTSLLYDIIFCLLSLLAPFKISSTIVPRIPEHAEYLMYSLISAPSGPIIGTSPALLHNIDPNEITFGITECASVIGIDGSEKVDCRLESYTLLGEEPPSLDNTPSCSSTGIYPYSEKLTRWKPVTATHWLRYANILPPRLTNALRVAARRERDGIGKVSPGSFEPTNSFRMSHRQSVLSTVNESDESEEAETAEEPGNMGCSFLNIFGFPDSKSKRNVSLDESDVKFFGESVSEKTPKTITKLHPPDSSPNLHSASMRIAGVQMSPQAGLYEPSVSNRNAAQTRRTPHISFANRTLGPWGVGSIDDKFGGSRLRKKETDIILFHCDEMDAVNPLTGVKEYSVLPEELLLFAAEDDEDVGSPIVILDVDADALSPYYVDPTKLLPSHLSLRLWKSIVQFANLWGSTRSGAPMPPPLPHLPSSTPLAELEGAEKLWWSLQKEMESKGWGSQGLCKDMPPTVEAIEQRISQVQSTLRQQAIEKGSGNDEFTLASTLLSTPGPVSPSVDNDDRIMAFWDPVTSGRWEQQGPTSPGSTSLLSQSLPPMIPRSLSFYDANETNAITQGQFLPLLLLDTLFSTHSKLSLATSNPIFLPNNESCGVGSSQNFFLTLSHPASAVSAHDSLFDGGSDSQKAHLEDRPNEPYALTISQEAPYAPSIRTMEYLYNDFEDEDNHFGEDMDESIHDVTHDVEGYEMPEEDVSLRYDMQPIPIFAPWESWRQCIQVHTGMERLKFLPVIDKKGRSQFLPVPPAPLHWPRIRLKMQSVLVSLLKSWRLYTVTQIASEVKPFCPVDMWPLYTPGTINPWVLTTNQEDATWTKELEKSSTDVDSLNSPISEDVESFEYKPSPLRCIAPGEKSPDMPTRQMPFMSIASATSEIGFILDDLELELFENNVLNASSNTSQSVPNTPKLLPDTPGGTTRSQSIHTPGTNLMEFPRPFPPLPPRNRLSSASESTILHIAPVRPSSMSMCLPSPSRFSMPFSPNNPSPGPIRPARSRVVSFRFQKSSIMEAASALNSAGPLSSFASKGIASSAPINIIRNMTNLDATKEDDIAQQIPEVSAVFLRGTEPVQMPKPLVRTSTPKYNVGLLSSQRSDESGIGDSGSPNSRVSSFRSPLNSFSSFHVTGSSTTPKSVHARSRSSSKFLVQSQPTLNQRGQSYPELRDIDIGFQKEQSELTVQEARSNVMTSENSIEALVVHRGNPGALFTDNLSGKQASSSSLRLSADLAFNTIETESVARSESMHNTAQILSSPVSSRSFRQGFASESFRSGTNRNVYEKMDNRMHSLVFPTVRTASSSFLVTETIPQSEGFMEYIIKKTMWFICWNDTNVIPQEEALATWRLRADIWRDEVMKLVHKAQQDGWKPPEDDDIHNPTGVQFPYFIPPPPPLPPLGKVTGFDRACFDRILFQSVHQSQLAQEEIEGVMYKAIRGTFGRGWNKRLCVLSQGKITYYENSDRILSLRKKLDSLRARLASLPLHAVGKSTFTSKVRNETMKELEQTQAQLEQVKKDSFRDSFQLIPGRTIINVPSANANFHYKTRYVFQIVNPAVKNSNNPKMDILTLCAESGEVRTSWILHIRAFLQTSNFHGSIPSSTVFSSGLSQSFLQKLRSLYLFDADGEFERLLLSVPTWVRELLYEKEKEESTLTESVQFDTNLLSPANVRSRTNTLLSQSVGLEGGIIGPRDASDSVYSEATAFLPNSLHPLITQQILGHDIWSDHIPEEERVNQYRESVTRILQTSLASVPRKSRDT